MMEYPDVMDFFEDLLQRSSPARPAWNQEALLENREPSWNYIDGCMLKAVLDLYRATGESRYAEFVEQYVDTLIDEQGTILGYHPEDYNCDNINEGKVLFDLFDLTGKAKYRGAIDQLYSQLQCQPRTAEENFWHKKMYPNQVWLDGLYMVQPFYMAYERRFHENRNYRDVFIQFETVARRMRDASSGLLYHGYDESKKNFWANPKTGCSPNFWTRSLGWYTMALVDTAEQMDEMFFYEYQTLQEQLRLLIDSLLCFLDPETGLFYQVTDAGNRPGNYLETSGSCAIAYATLKAVRLEYLPEYYFENGKRIFDGVLRHKFIKSEDGYELKDICLVAGLGGYPGKGDYKVRDGSFAYYISEPKVNNDAKGVAPFLFAFAELLRKEGETL